MTSAQADHWTQRGQPSLDSFAAIRDEPTPEVAVTGHQRTIITIQEHNFEAWLSPSQLNKEQIERILTDRETLYYVHQFAA